MTPKQARFVDEYLVDLNASQAAVRAGYKGDPNTIGPRLLANDGIARAITEGQKKRSEATGVEAERVLRELASLAFYDPAVIGSASIRRPEDIANLPEHVRRAIAGWSWDRNGNFTIRLAAKTPNLELLARHLGMLQAGAAVVVDDPVDGEDGKQRRITVYVPANGRDG